MAFAGVGCWYTKEGVYRYGRKTCKHLKSGGRIPEYFTDEETAGGSVEKSGTAGNN